MIDHILDTWTEGGIDYEVMQNCQIKKTLDILLVLLDLPPLEGGGPRSIRTEANIRKGARGPGVTRPAGAHRF